jgi:hypothetical protein
MDHEGSLQEPATGLGPEPDELSPYAHPISPRSITILSYLLRLGIPSSLCPSGFPTKSLYQAPFASCVLHVLLISSF